MMGNTLPVGERKLVRKLMFYLFPQARKSSTKGKGTGCVSLTLPMPLLKHLIYISHWTVPPVSACITNFIYSNRALCPRPMAGLLYEIFALSLRDACLFCWYYGYWIQFSLLRSSLTLCYLRLERFTY